MRYFIYLLFAGIIFQLTGCDKKKDNLVKISIHYPKAAGDTIRIGRENIVNLESIDMGKVVLDSAGKGAVQVAVAGPVFAFVNGNHMAAGLLLYPGDNIAIVPSSKGAKFAIRFEGDGAAANQIYNEGHQVTQGFEKWNGTHYLQLEPDEFVKAKDSLQKSYEQLLARANRDNKESAERLDVVRRQNDMHVAFYQYNYAAGKDSSEIPASIRETVKKLPVDTIAVKTGMFYYALLTSYFYRQQINNAIYEEHEEMDGDSLESIFPLLVEKKVKAAGYPKPVEEFVRAMSAHIQIEWGGLTANRLKIVNTLGKEIASEDFKRAIREDVARWEKIGPGKPAPDFVGMTPEGKKLALSDLRGKVVYVDIWATWCGYCIDEFPDSKKLQTEFKGNDQVAFLYVSVDEDTLAWKKMAAGKKVPNGLHMLNANNTSGSIWNLYHVSGIPRYLLVDAQGRMVAAHAERPSSGKVADELKRLLGADKLAKN